MTVGSKPVASSSSSASSGSSTSVGTGSAGTSALAPSVMVVVPPGTVEVIRLVMVLVMSSTLGAHQYKCIACREETILTSPPQQS